MIAPLSWVEAELGNKRRIPEWTQNDDDDSDDGRGIPGSAGCKLFSPYMVKSSASSAGLHLVVTLFGFPLNSVAHAYPLLMGYSTLNTLPRFLSSGPTFSDPAEFPPDMRLRGHSDPPKTQCVVRKPQSKGAEKNHIKGPL